MGLSPIMKVGYDVPSLQSNTMEMLTKYRITHINQNVCPVSVICVTDDIILGITYAIYLLFSLLLCRNSS